MSSVQRYTIFKARRVVQNNSLGNSYLISTKTAKLSNTPIVQNTPLPHKKLEFNSKKRQRMPSPIKNLKKSKLSQQTN